jgi:hypothetical protein
MRGIVTSKSIIHRCRTICDYEFYECLQRHQFALSLKVASSVNLNPSQSLGNTDIYPSKLRDCIRLRRVSHLYKKDAHAYGDRRVK